MTDATLGNQDGSQRQTCMVFRTSFTALVLLALTACSSGGTNDQRASAPPTFDEAFTVGLTEDRQTALLRFDPESDLAEIRGVAWRLEEWNGTSWESKWILAGGAFRLEAWSDGNYDVGSVGVHGVGPDVVPLPTLAAGVHHRVCHGLDDSEPGGCGTLPAAPTEPNSAATTMPEPTTTVADDE